MKTYLKCCIVCMISIISLSGAAVLNWNSVDWPAGALNQPYVVEGVTCDLTFGGDTQYLLTNPPFSQDLPDDDHSYAVSGLWWGANFDTQAVNPAITLTIEFSQPVSAAAFELYDIDGVLSSGQWETTQVDAYLGIAPVAPVFVPGAHVTVAGNILGSDGFFDGEPGDAGNTAAVGLVFGDMIDTIVLTYQSNADANRGQLIGNIEFVPEPATLLMFGAGGFLLRKRR